MNRKEIIVTSSWRQSIIEYIRSEAQPVDKFGHQPRLYALACQLGQGLAFDDDILFAEQWPRPNRIHLPTVITYHLCAQPPTLGENWDGHRSQPRLSRNY